MIVQAATTLPAHSLTRSADAILYPTVALAELNVAVARQIADTRPPDTPPARPRRVAEHTGGKLFQLDWPAEAPPVTQEALEIRRNLAAASGHRAG